MIMFGLLRLVFVWLLAQQLAAIGINVEFLRNSLRDKFFLTCNLEIQDID